MKMFAGTLAAETSYQAFAAPEDILIDDALAGAERRRLLDAWKRALERAQGCDVDVSARPQELLRRVNACRRLLSEEDH